MTNPGTGDARPLTGADPDALLRNVMQRRAADEAVRRDLPRDTVWEPQDPPPTWDDPVPGFEQRITEHPEEEVETVEVTAEFGNAWAATQRAEEALEGITWRNAPVASRIELGAALAGVAQAYALLALRAELTDIAGEIRQVARRTDEIGLVLSYRRQRSAWAVRIATWAIIGLMVAFAFMAGMEVR